MVWAILKISIPKCEKYDFFSRFKQCDINLPLTVKTEQVKRKPQKGCVHGWLAIQNVNIKSLMACMTTLKLYSL